MKRDGTLESLWQKTTPEFNSKNNNWNDKLFDVVIVGGGITGVTTALLLQQQGKQCLIAESFNIGFGTTSGTTAHLNTLLDTPYSIIEKNFGEDGAKLVAKGAKEAIDIVEILSSKYKINNDFSYQYATLFAQNEDENKELKKIFEATIKAGVEGRWTDKIPVPADFTIAAEFAGQAQMHPTRYIAALAQAFEAAGGVIVQNCKVTDVKDGEILNINTTQGVITANNLVWATHLPPGINLFNFRCAPYRSYAAAFKLADGTYPAGLAYDMKDPYHYYRSQTIDGEKYLIAGGYDHKTGHNENTGFAFTELDAHIHNLYKGSKISAKWSSQYYESVDGLPYIGLMPGSDNVYAATGYGGNGMTYGTLAARIVTDLITTKYSIYKDIFSPSRMKPIAGLSNFIKENADAISSFIGKRLNYESIEQLAELAPGEARVTEFNGEKMALYKDDNGKVHAFDPVCPHAKCIVNWNTAEKTWDCPCHGGRYSCMGQLITGPATKGLERITIYE